MRWALSNTIVPCFGGTIPQKLTKSGVEGILFHELLESYDQHSREHHDARFRPRSTSLALLERWDRKNESNSRINSKALAGQIGIEDLLTAFGQAAAYIVRPDHKGASKPDPVQSNKCKGLVSHAEVWLRDPESKLCGRADHIQSGAIVDFKSGDQRADHIEQLLFYAALYLAVTGETPKALRLIYAARNSILNVPIPRATVLRQSLTEMRHRGQAHTGR